MKTAKKSAPSSRRFFRDNDAADFMKIKRRPFRGVLQFRSAEG
jgi:hypothetical protein